MQQRMYFLVFPLIALLAAACGGGADSGTTAADGSSPSAPMDTTAPSVTITGPTSASSYSTSSAAIVLSGSASDNVGVTQVTWSNSRGGSGSASGTVSWNTGSIALQGGSNTLTITARDAAGNTATDTLLVSFSTGTPGDTTAPSISITSPTSGSSYTTTSGSLSLGGTASDNVGVTQITWLNNRGGSGTASGTTSWSIGSITLQGGSNVITVTARDAAGNQNTDTLTVTYNAPDTTAPTVSSTSPAGGSSNVPTGIAISVTFSETMSAASIISGTFTIGGVSGSISVSDATATLTPSSALAPSTSYTVNVLGGTGGVKDAAGNALSSNYSWTFTTAAPSDCAGSTVLCVDDTAGATREFATIQAAVDAALPGDTVLVYDGNYAGFEVSRSGTSAAPIVFRGNGSNVVINSNGPTSDGIRLQNVSHITVEGFQIQGVSERCISAKGATADSPMTSNVLRNNRCTNSGADCIYVSQFSNSRLENNVLNRCGAAGSTRSHGIYLANAGSDNTVIRGNTISNITPAESEGIHINGDLSIGGDGIVSGLTIEDNVVYDVAVNGLSMDGVQDSLIRNNLFYGNGRHGVRGYQADGAAGPANLRIVNNTFIGSGGWAVKLSEDRGGHTIFNNILLGSSGSLCVGTSNLVSNNNAVTDGLSFDEESSVVGLGVWRTQTGDDANSFVSTSSALFINAGIGDHRLSGTSPAVNAGRSSLNGVQAPANDLSGGTRPQGTAYDLGAYESSL